MGNSENLSLFSRRFTVITDMLCMFVVLHSRRRLRLYTTLHSIRYINKRTGTRRAMYSARRPYLNERTVSVTHGSRRAAATSVISNRYTRGHIPVWSNNNWQSYYKAIKPNYRCPSKATATTAAPCLPSGTRSAMKVRVPHPSRWTAMARDTPMMMIMWKCGRG